MVITIFLQNNFSSELVQVVSLRSSISAIHSQVTLIKYNLNQKSA